MPIVSKGDGCPNVMAQVGGLEVEFQLDTGSTHSFSNAPISGLEAPGRVTKVITPPPPQSTA